MSSRANGSRSPPADIAHDASRPAGGTASRAEPGFSWRGVGGSLALSDVGVRGSLGSGDSGARVKWGDTAAVSGASREGKRNAIEPSPRKLTKATDVTDATTRKTPPLNFVNIDRLGDERSRILTAPDPLNGGPSGPGESRRHVELGAAWHARHEDDEDTYADLVTSPRTDRSMYEV
jgi:hypothetical protein